MRLCYPTAARATSLRVPLVRRARFWKRLREQRARKSIIKPRYELRRRLDMDWNRVEGNWKQVKGKVKEQWGKLTDDDLNMIGGKREQLEGKIQERYGYNKDQVRKEIDDWYSTHRW